MPRRVRRGRRNDLARGGSGAVGAVFGAVRNVRQLIGIVRKDLGESGEITHLGDLRPDPANARRHNPRNIGMIEDALHEVGAARSIVIDEDGVILAGNGVVEAAAQAGIEKVQVVDADGETIVAVRRTGLTVEQKRRLALFDNRTAELADWDAEALAALVAEDAKSLDGLFTGDELAGLLARLEEPVARITPEEAHKTLAERFIVPPFSVLDARQGYWQKRKSAWIALGIQSELGRGDNLTGGGYSDQSINIDFYAQKRALETELGKMLSTDEAREILFDRGTIRHISQAKGGRLTWVAGNRDGEQLDETSRKILAGGRGLARSFGQDPMKGEHVVGQSRDLLGKSEQARSHYGGRPPHGPKVAQNADGSLAYQPTNQGEGQSGTSVFDPVLCELAYCWFCPLGGKVLDPFAGGSVRGIVAAVLDRQYVGIDLSERQIEANREQAAAILGSVKEQTDESISVNVSAKWARHLFACSVEHIRDVCKGSCCEGSDKILVSLLPDEQECQIAAGHTVKDGLLQPDSKTGKCPHKQSDGLCRVHGTTLKPFGCIASPFTLNGSDTLIIRNRYSLMKCHGEGEPAYRCFRSSLDLIFGDEEAGRICAQLEANNGDVRADMPAASYWALHYLDGLKHGVESASKGAPKWVVGDGADAKSLAPDTYDFVFTCPPIFRPRTLQ